MKIYSNKGMCLEALINETAYYYENNNIALIYKRSVPIEIYKVDNKQVNGILKSKALTDYYGIYKGVMIDFEAKQTTNDYFLLNNLKKHQYEHLIKVNQFNGISFLILFFVKFNAFYIIDVQHLNNLYLNKINKIDKTWCDKNAFKIELLFPTHLDIKKYLDTVIQ